MQNKLFFLQSKIPLLYIGLCLITLACLQAFYFTHNFPDFNWFYNSDTLYLPALYKDLIKENGHLASWYLTPSPYFFPDIILYFIINAITNDFYISVGLYFLFQLLFIYVLVYLIYSAFLTRKKAVIISSFSFLYFCMLASLLKKPFAYTLISAFHVGAFISLLLLVYCAILALKKNEKEQSWIIFIFILLISALSILSDKLILVHAILPMLATLFMMKVTPPFKGLLSTKTYLLTSSALVLGAALGRALYKQFVPNQTDFSAAIELDPAGLTQNIKWLDESFSSMRMIGHGAWLMFFIFYALCLVIFLFINRTKDESPEKKMPVYFFSLFALISLAATLLLFLFAKNTSGWGLNSRYFLPLFYLPILFVPLLGAFLSHRFQKILLSPLFIIVPIFIFSHIFNHRTIDLTKIKSEYYPEIFHCIDNVIEKENLQYGAAQYWNARYTAMLSHHNVNIVSLRQELTPYVWIINKDWFKGNYDFILLDSKTAAYEKLDEKLITQLNGPPLKVKQCENLTFLIYPKGKLALPAASSFKNN